MVAMMTGFPQFKSKRRASPAVRFTTGAIRVEPDRKHVALPVLGTIKTHESTRKLQRRIADGRARVLSATFLGGSVETREFYPTLAADGFFGQTCVEELLDDYSFQILHVLARRNRPT
jgi:hypothetical protein